ncbi:tyrosine-protein phosphatase [Paraconexibacter sp.]|uniref:tyrosine-protein phosphatase n=1 Tax=Paraconexibacter sp. TaxID=2949640 RepID=UPI0035692421
MADTTSPTTAIDLDGTVNTRDVGGIPLSDGAAVRPGVLLRSDNLQDLSARDIATLVDGMGLRAVIDLRTEYELVSEGPGPLEADTRVRIEHRSLYPETGGGTDLDLATIVPWGDGQGADLPDETPTVRAYLGYLKRRPDSVVGALRTISESDGATLVHCAAGKDRTGVVVAIALSVAGADRDAIVADYLATAENIEAIVARLAASPTYTREISADDPHVHAPREGAMERVLELLDRDHGGVPDWLESHGFGPDEQAALRRRLRSDG